MQPFEYSKESIQSIINNKEYHVGIYCRLSIDDGPLQNESVSIKNQKKFLTQYVNDNNWQIYDYYIDDGFSGTNFDRPDFKRMILDIEKGHVNLVITKDLSRLGRDYLTTGFYMDNFFPDHNVRYIAVNDGVDSINLDDDFLPFKNIINEMYAKDISKKIRFTVNNNIRKGELQTAPIPFYGYLNVDNKRVPNPETAPVVKMIFNYYKTGMSIADIVYELEKQKILTPMWYAKKKWGYDPKFIQEKNKYKWHPNVIARMIDSKEYLGTLIRGKTISKFKTKKKWKATEEEQYIFDNKFEPLIDIDTFNECQAIHEKMKSQYHTRITTPYSGLCYCGVCGNKLRYKANDREDGTNNARITCRSSYEDEKGTILVEDLNTIMTHEIMTLKEVVLSHEEEFIAKARECAEGSIDVLKYSREIETVKSLTEQCSKIDFYIKKAFEQYTRLVLPESTYKSMVTKYMAEKESLEAEINDLKSKIEIDSKNAPNYDYEARKYIEALKSITEENCLNRVKLTSLVSKIYIKTDGIKKKRKKQNKYIEIIYHTIDPLIKDFLADYEE